MWIQNIHFSVIHRHSIHDHGVQNRDQVISVAWNQKVLSVNCCQCMEKKRQGRCKWNWRILEHSVCPEAVQLVSLIEIGLAVRVIKWAVYWTDSVVAERDVATPLLAGRRSEMFVLRPSSKQLGNNCTVYYIVHLSHCSGYWMWHRVLFWKGSVQTVYLCVLCGSENKQRLFHCTALTGWFL